MRASKAVHEVVRNRTEILFKPLDMTPNWLLIAMPGCTAVLGPRSMNRSATISRERLLLSLERAIWTRRDGSI